MKTLLRGDDATKCETAEISFMVHTIAMMCDVSGYGFDSDRNYNDYPNAEFVFGQVCGSCASPKLYPSKNWMTPEEYAFKTIGEPYMKGITLEEIHQRLKSQQHDT
jgi:hypothetical protein